MLLSLKKLLKWNTTKTSETKKSQKSLLLAGFTGLLEDVLFWRKLWLSLFFMFLLNIVFFVSVHRQISLFKFILSCCIAILIIDAFESWLKYKHRTTCLKRLANYESKQLTAAAVKFNQWLRNKWNDLLYLRETNHTKAFLLVNINLVIIFLTAKYINGYVLIYLMLMLICIFYKAILPLLKAVKNMKQDFESDNELEGLIPEVSEGDIKILSIEPEPASTPDERQIYDYWKPEEVPLAECSDSSDNSSSLVTNLSMEKMHNLEKDVESSDNSDDEYIPLDQQGPETRKEQLKTTLEVVEPSSSWSSSAYNTFWNFTGAVANMMQKEPADSKRKRLLSADSSDGFEMIDKNDLT